MKKKIIKIVVFLLGLIALSVGIYFIFYACGISDLSTLRAIINDCGVWSWVVFLLLQIVFTVLLCFIPGSSMAFITLGVLCFGADWKTFLLTFSGVIISSAIMYILGRFGGYTLCAKIVGKEDMEKATKLIKEKGQVYYPIMMCCAGFPDDALVCVAGMIKMNPLFFVLSTIIGRGIGVACIVFGISILPYEFTHCTSTNLWDYIEVISICCFWLFLVFFLAYKINNKFFNKKQQKEYNKDKDIKEKE